MFNKEKQFGLILHTFLTYFFLVKASFWKQFYVFVHKHMNPQYCVQGKMNMTRKSSETSDLICQMIWKKVYGKHTTYRVHKAYVEQAPYGGHTSGMCSIHGTQRIQDTWMKRITISIRGTCKMKLLLYVIIMVCMIYLILCLCTCLCVLQFWHVLYSCVCLSLVKFWLVLYPCKDQQNANKIQYNTIHTPYRGHMNEMGHHQHEGHIQCELYT
jgi:hypothetical protein